MTEELALASGPVEQAAGDIITVADLVNYGFRARYNFKNPATLTLVSTDHVSQVNDQFGTQHLTQTVDANRPQALGGSAGVRFNDSSDVLLYPVSSSLVSARTFTVVASLAAAPSAGQYIINSIPNAQGAKAFWITGTEGVATVTQINIADYKNLTVMPRDNTQRTFMASLNIGQNNTPRAVSLNARFDGVGDIRVGPTWVPDEGSGTIRHGIGGGGGVNSGVFVWKDMVATNKVMPWSELPFYEAVMAWEHGTQGSLPAGHPYQLARPVLPAVASFGITRVKTGWGLWSGPANLGTSEIYLGQHYIGPPAYNRVVLVVVTARQGAPFTVPVSVAYPTINGVICDANTYVSASNGNVDGNSASVVTEVFWQPVPTGNYADISMWQPLDDTHDYQFSVYVLNGLKSVAKFHSATSNTPDGSVALNIPSVGGVIAADCSKISVAWTGVTEDLDVSYAGYHGAHVHSTAFNVNLPPQIGRPISVSSPGTYDMLVAVSFGFDDLGQGTLTPGVATVAGTGKVSWNGVGVGVQDGPATITATGATVAWGTSPALQAGVAHLFVDASVRDGKGLWSKLDGEWIPVYPRVWRGGWKTAQLSVKVYGYWRAVT